MNIRKQFFIFCIGGTLGFAVDVTLLYAFTEILGWYGARLLSFFCAATTTWIFNRFYTFRRITAERRTSDHNTLQEFTAYLVSVSGGAVINYAAYAAIIHIWGNSLQSPFIGVACGSIAGMIVNFISVRYIVFRSKS